MTVVVSGARSLFALKTARAFAAAGARVITTDSLAVATAGVSRGSHRYVRTSVPIVEPLQFQEDVIRLFKEERPDLWIPSYEEIFYLAWLRKNKLPELPLLAPSFAQLAQVHDKGQFAELARSLSISPPETIRLTETVHLTSLANRAREFVFKPIWSRGGDRVLVQPTPEQLSSLRPTPQDPWLAQTYLPGEEISVHAIANHGQLLTHIAYRPLHRAGHGASIAFEQVFEPEAENFTRLFIETTKWHGQVAFDLRRDATGHLLPIECNPRATSGIHFLRDEDLVAALTGHKPTMEKAGQKLVIRLALLTYGLTAALHGGNALTLWKDCFNGRDIIWRKNDPRPYFQQIAFIRQADQIARDRKISIHAAFTDDLEWNGQPMA